MRTFECWPNEAICPACGTQDQKPCVLIGIAGTEKDNNMQALPVHADCVDPENMRIFKPNQLPPFIYIEAPFYNEAMKL